MEMVANYYSVSVFRFELLCFVFFLHVLEKAWAVAVENWKRELTKSLSQTR